MVILEQFVRYAHVRCVSNPTLELINFSHNLIRPVIFDVFNELS